MFRLSNEDRARLDLSLHQLGFKDYLSYYNGGLFIKIKKLVLLDKQNRCTKCCSNKDLIVFPTKFNFYTLSGRNIKGFDVLCDSCVKKKINQQKILNNMTQEERDAYFEARKAKRKKEKEKRKLKKQQQKQVESEASK